MKEKDRILVTEHFNSAIRHLARTWKLYVEAGEKPPRQVVECLRSIATIKGVPSEVLPELDMMLAFYKN